MYKNRSLNRAARFYNFFVWVGSNLQSLFLLYMRVTWGHQFFIVGVAQLRSMDQFVQLLTSLDIPNPVFYGYFVALSEAIGGFLLFIGLGSRLAAVPLIIAMLTALGTAHAPNICNYRFLLEPLCLVRQEPYPFLITSLLVFIFGPGRISFDAWIKRWLSKQPTF